MTTPPDDSAADTPDISDEHILPSQELKRLWKQFNHISAKAPEHARLRQLTGNWDLEGAFDACGYGPHFSAKGRMIGTPRFDGRFVQLEWTIESKLANWELSYQLGFDNVIGKYSLSMIESIHNGTLIGEGTWHPGDSSIRYWGEYSNPMFKTRHDCLIVIRFVSAELVVTEMHVPDRDGKFMEKLHFSLQRAP